MQKKNFLKNLGLYIKMERLKQGISQEELADISGCGLSLIGTLERGEKAITFYNLYKIVKSLNLDFSKLLKALE